MCTFNTYIGTKHWRSLTSSSITRYNIKNIWNEKKWHFFNWIFLFLFCVQLVSLCIHERKWMLFSKVSHIRTSGVFYFVITNISRVTNTRDSFITFLFLFLKMHIINNFWIIIKHRKNKFRNLFNIMVCFLFYYCNYYIHVNRWCRLQTVVIWDLNEFFCIFNANFF